MKDLKQQIINLIIERTMNYLSDKVITEENIDKIVNDMIDIVKSMDKEEIKKIAEITMYGVVGVKVKSKINEF